MLSVFTQVLSQQSCHIEPTPLSQFGSSPLRFTYSSIDIDIKQSVYALHRNVAIEDSTYTVKYYNGCKLEVFFKTTPMQMPHGVLSAAEDAARNSRIMREEFLCTFTGHSLPGQTDNTRPRARFIKAFGIDTYNRVEIPYHWQSDDDNVAVIMIRFPVFPTENRTTISCSYQEGNSNSWVMIRGSFAIEKAGCPRGIFGGFCSNRCYWCENGATCDTFSGRTCHCRYPYYGYSCSEKDPDTAVPQTTIQPHHTTRHTTRHTARHATRHADRPSMIEDPPLRLEPLSGLGVGGLIGIGGACLLIFLLILIFVLACVIHRRNRIRRSTVNSRAPPSDMTVNVTAASQHYYEDPPAYDLLFDKAEVQ